MKLQIDTTHKIIKVEEQVNFGTLVKTLNKLLPKGEWKTYRLETNTVINWNKYPVWTYPAYPTYPNYPFYYATCRTTSSITLLDDNDVSVTIIDTDNSLMLDGAVSGTYNIDI